MRHKLNKDLEPESLYSLAISSPLGKIILQSDGTALVRAYFPDAQPIAAGLGQDGDPGGILAATRQWFEAYFAGGRPAPDTLPLNPSGTVYQQSVWRIMQRVGYGQRCSYGDICRALSQASLPPGSPRAAGAAAGRNPIGIIIPCHRILGASGKLTGFAAGLWRKEWLLNHETGACH